jgi:hypothetical protein
MPARISQEEWDALAASMGLEWLEPVKTSKTPTLVKCLKCGYGTEGEYRKTPDTARQGRGCLNCSGKRKRTQAEWDADAAKLNLKWRDKVKNKGNRTACECLICGYGSEGEWITTPNSVRRGHGCPECGGTRKITQAEWDAHAEALDLRWREEVKSAMTPTACECLVCGYGSEGEWKPWPLHVRRGHGCRPCSELLPLKSQEERDEEARAVGVKWLETIKNSYTPTRAECLECGHRWLLRPNHAQSGKSCPACSDHGFDPLAPTTVYLIGKEDGTIKIGVAAVGEATKRRLRIHRRNGYTKVWRTWEMATGVGARAVEQETIRVWREEDDLLPAAPQGEDGWIETVHAESLPVRTIVSRVEKLIGLGGAS